MQQYYFSFLNQFSDIFVDFSGNYSNLFISLDEFSYVYLVLNSNRIVYHTDHTEH